MRTEAFRSWLRNVYRTRRGHSLAARTIDSRIANCVTVEHAEGNLDTHFDRDQMLEVIGRLTYSRSDELNRVPARHKVLIDGDLYDGTATLKSAVLLYKEFRMNINQVLTISADVSTELPQKSQFSTDDVLTEFFRQALFYRYHEKFDDYERLYKIRLANYFSTSRQLVQSDSQRSLKLFAQALQSKDDNIIDWRDRGTILNWIRSSPRTFTECLNDLWKGSSDLEERFSSFCKALNQNGVTQTGGQLAITSTLLMTLSPFRYPPVKTESFSAGMMLAGWKRFATKETAFERYSRALLFLDELVKKSLNYDVELRDRLDAQGVVWCVSGGWPKLPVPPDWKNDPEQRKKLQDLTYAAELAELEAEPDSSNLTTTEKLTLVQARRGQAKFREDLVKLWNCCSVTHCSNLTFLRASHIIPWKSSDNRQRLDPYNGLLLSPNLDVAFDAGLISFEQDGRIKISDELEAKDRKLLGIHSKLHLREVREKHLPYLRYHKIHVFEKKSS